VNISGSFARRSKADAYTFCVIPALETLDWHRFLGRPALRFSEPAAQSNLRARRILVTGAGGSIGSALACRLQQIEPGRLILLEASEGRLFGLQGRLSRLQVAREPTFVLGDAGDADLLEELFAEHHPDLVIHTAAYKHVPLLEHQPLAAIENNIFVTETLAAAAAKRDAQVVFLSTDKAVEPASVMGATKRVAEEIVLAKGGTAVRLANVLASSDSVAEIFARQVAGGEPLTVTQRTAERYFITIAEAVDLLVCAAEWAETGQLLAPALSVSHRIGDLAEFMVRELGGGRPAQILYTHPRPGDKEAERMWAGNESAVQADGQSLVSIAARLHEKHAWAAALDRLHAAVAARELPAALDELRYLAPGYRPSATVLALASRSELRV